MEEFYSAYNDAEAFYTFVTGNLWLETESIMHGNFMFNPSDYTKEPSFDSDLTELDRKYIKKGRKIQRVYL